MQHATYENWAVSSVRDLLCKIDTTNSISLKAGSGRPRTVRMEQNIERVAIQCDESLRDLHSFMSSDATRCTCSLILIVDQWWRRLKAIVQVHKGHIEQLFTWLSGCCMLLLLRYRHNHALLLCFPLWHNNVGVLWLCCNFFEQPVDILIWFRLLYM